MEAIRLTKLIFEQAPPRMGGVPKIRKVTANVPGEQAKHNVLMVNGKNEPYLVIPSHAKKVLKDIANYAETGKDPSKHRRTRDGVRIATIEEIDWFIEQITETGIVPTSLVSGSTMKAQTILEKQADYIAQLEAKLKAGQVIEQPIQEMPVQVPSVPQSDLDTFTPPFPEPETPGQKASNTRALNKFNARKEAINA